MCVKNKVLLVEENNINRRVMSALLKSLKTVVVDSKDGFEAFEQVKNNDFSLILMDLSISSPDGLETAKRIRGLNGTKGSVPIIALTTKDPKSVKEQVLESGMDGVLKKPLKKNELEVIVNRYIGFKELAVFNQKEFEKQFDDAHLRSEIVKTFLEESIPDMKNIVTSFKTKDCNEIHKVVHYLKGTFSYLRADRIMKLSQTIVDYSRKDMIDEIMKLENQLLENYELLVKRLKDYK